MSNEQERNGEDPRDEPGEQEPVYSYETADLTEREGRVPLWLWLVVVVLVIWGVYYMIANWRPPA